VSYVRRGERVPRPEQLKYVGAPNQILERRLPAFTCSQIDHIAQIAIAHCARVVGELCDDRLVKVRIRREDVPVAAGDVTDRLA
jgi:hypothetical protein